VEAVYGVAVVVIVREGDNVPVSEIRAMTTSEYAQATLVRSPSEAIAMVSPAEFIVDENGVMTVGSFTVMRAPLIVPRPVIHAETNHVESAPWIRKRLEDPGINRILAGCNCAPVLEKRWANAPSAP